LLLLLSLSLLLLSPLPLPVLAVILNAVKDPEEFNSPTTLRPFLSAHYPSSLIQCDGD
jgi:hypothetical protein